MALKPCKECGKEISTSAKLCPNCGRKYPTGGLTIPAKIFVGIIVLVVIGKLFGGSGASNASTSAVVQSGSSVSTPPVPKVTISAQELFAYYQQNEVAADNDLKGKWFGVTGVVDGIKKDFTD